jgi:hypothetical protein
MPGSTDKCTPRRARPRTGKRARDTTMPDYRGDIAMDHNCQPIPLVLRAQHPKRKEVQRKPRH